MFFDRRKIKVSFRPEVVLVGGLRERGHDVVTYNHWERFAPRRYDVLHVHALGMGALRAVFAAAHTPFIYTAHDCRAMHGLLGMRHSLGLRAVLAQVDAVVALSKPEAKFLTRTYGLDPCQVKIIPNGIDQNCFYYRRANGGGREVPFRILYAGQLQALKAVDVLLRALAKLQKPWILDLVFHVGDTRCALERLVDELRIRDRVVFVGQITSNALATRYQEVDILVIPSLTEALPSVVSEAMLCGTPVLATDVGGVRDQLSGYGVLVPPNNVDSLAAGLAHIMERYQQFSAQGEAMSAHAREAFSIERMISAHEALYSEICIRRRRKGLLSQWPICAIGMAATQMAVAIRKRRCSAS